MSKNTGFGSVDNSSSSSNAEQQPPIIEKEKKKNVELFSFCENHKLQYKGLIYFQCYKTLKLLCFNPGSEDEINIPFSRQFIRVKNILCIVGPKQPNDLVLLFRKEESCKTIYDFILETQLNINNENLQTLFNERFRGPLLDGVENNNEINQRLKEIMKDLIHLPAGSNLMIQLPQAENIPTINIAPIDFGDNDLDGSEASNQETEKIAAAFKSNNLAENGGSSSFMNEPTNNENEIDHNDRNSEPPMEEQESINDDIKIFKSSDYELVKLHSNDLRNSRLSIFASKDKFLCYEFYWRGANIFYCEGCRKLKADTVKAKLIINSDGSQHIEADNSHICRPIKYCPYIKEENLFNYFEFGQCKTKKGAPSRNLIVFDDETKKFCRVFSKYKNIFYCAKCRAINCTRVYATILSDENAGVQVGPNSHICQAIPYPIRDEMNLRNHNLKAIKNQTHNGPVSSLFKKSVHPQFIIQYNECVVGVPTTITSKSTTKKLLSSNFGENDFDQGTETSIQEINNFNSNEPDVSEEIVETLPTINAPTTNNKENAENEKPTKMNQPPKLTKTIFFNSSQFELVKLNSNDLTHSRLSIFSLDNKSMCFDYFYNSSSKAFCCEGCRRLKFNNVKAWLFYKLNGEPYIEAMDSHVCKAIEYKPFNKEENIYKADKFKFERCKTSKGLDSRNLILFEDNEKKFCRIFIKDKNLFYCNKCRLNSVRVNAAILKDENNGERHIQVFPNSHVCDVVRYSNSIRNKNLKLSKKVMELENKSFNEAAEMDPSNDIDFNIDPIFDSVPETSIKSQTPQNNLNSVKNFEADLNPAPTSQKNMDYETNLNVESPNPSLENLNSNNGTSSSFIADSVSKSSEKETQTIRETSETIVDSPSNSSVDKVSPRISPVKLKLKKDGTYLNLKSGSNSPTTSVNETSTENAIPPTNFDTATVNVERSSSEKFCFNEQPTKKLKAAEFQENLNFATNLNNIKISTSPSPSEKISNDLQASEKVVSNLKATKYRSHEIQANNFDSIPQNKFEIRVKTIGETTYYYLYVFQDACKNFCYKYLYSVFAKSFICEEDAHSSKWIYAKLIKDANGDFYIHTKMHKHNCRASPYFLMNNNHDEILMEVSEYSNKFLESSKGKKFEKKKVEPEMVEKIDFNPRDLFAPESDDDEELENSSTTTPNFMKENNKDNLKRKFDPQNASTEWSPENKKFRISNCGNNENSEIHKIQEQQPKNLQKPLKSNYSIDSLLSS